MPEDILEIPSETSMLEFLKAAKGRQVTLLLQNGNSLTGQMAEHTDPTSPHARLVHLIALEGQDYFDAVVAKESITGVIFRRPGTP